VVSNGIKPLDSYRVSGKSFKTYFLELGYGNSQRHLRMTFGGYASVIVRKIAPDVMTVRCRWMYNNSEYRISGRAYSLSGPARRYYFWNYRWVGGIAKIRRTYTTDGRARFSNDYYIVRTNDPSTASVGRGVREMSDNNECGVLFSIPPPTHPRIHQNPVTVALEGLGNEQTFVIFDISVFLHPRNYITIIIIIIINTHWWLAGGGHLVFNSKSRASPIITTLYYISYYTPMSGQQEIAYYIQYNWTLFDVPI